MRLSVLRYSIAGALGVLCVVASLATPAMGAEQTETANKAVVQAFWTDVWAKRRFDRVDELFADDFVIHSAGKTIGPRDKFKAWVRSFFANIDDLELIVEDIFADGDKVITRWLCKGRFTGEMFGLKGKGQPIAFTGMNIMTVRDGRIVEAWVERDSLGLARQIGLIKN